MCGSSTRALIFLMALALGCASWDSPQTSLRIPPPQLPVDAITCELAFVQWDPTQVEKDRYFWNATDEQFLSPEVRGRLEENGLRVALLGGQLPAEIREKLESNADPVTALKAQKLPAGSEMLSRRENRQCRLGFA